MLKKRHDDEFGEGRPWASNFRIIFSAEGSNFPHNAFGISGSSSPFEFSISVADAVASESSRSSVRHGSRIPALCRLVYFLLKTAKDCASKGRKVDERNDVAYFVFKPSLRKWSTLRPLIKGYLFCHPLSCRHNAKMHFSILSQDPLPTPTSHSDLTLAFSSSRYVKSPKNLRPRATMLRTPPPLMPLPSV